MLLERTLATLDHQHGPGFGDHGSRVAVLCHATGRLLGLNQRDLGRLRFAALVHDLGKTGIDPEILEKPASLTDDELTLIRQHPQTGHDHLIDVAHPSVAEAVLCHHERWDGNGFPNGLKTNQIPLFARIIFIADAYDVMTTGRSYQPQLTVTQAGPELTRLAGRQFDPKIVDVFASIDRHLLTAPISRYLTPLVAP